MSAALGSLGQAMYVATKEDTLWLQNVQRALHTRSKEHPGYVFEKLWGLVTDPRNLRIAFARVQRGGEDLYGVNFSEPPGEDPYGKTRMGAGGPGERPVV